MLSVLAAGYFLLFLQGDNIKKFDAELQDAVALFRFYSLGFEAICERMIS